MPLSRAEIGTLLSLCLFHQPVWETDETPNPEANLNEDEIPINENKTFMEISADFTEVFKEQYKAPFSNLPAFVKDYINRMPARSTNVLQKAKMVFRKLHQSQNKLKQLIFF